MQSAANYSKINLVWRVGYLLGMIFIKSTKQLFILSSARTSWLRRQGYKIWKTTWILLSRRRPLAKEKQEISFQITEQDLGWSPAASFLRTPPFHSVWSIGSIVWFKQSESSFSYSNNDYYREKSRSDLDTVSLAKICGKKGEKVTPSHLVRKYLEGGGVNPCQWVYKVRSMQSWQRWWALRKQSSQEEQHKSNKELGKAKEDSGGFPCRG